MDLPSSLVKKFVDLTNENKERDGYYVYGTGIVSNGEKYVQLDGSDAVTSVSLATDLSTGDRVIVYVEDHVANVIGNITYPSSGRGLIEVSENLLDFESLTVGNLEAINGDIENIYANYVSTLYLESNYITAEYIVSNYLLAEDAWLTYATIDDLTATNARIDKITSTEITVEYLEANYANITELNVLKEQVQNLDAKYATIEWVEAGFATIDELWATYAYIYDLDVDIANIRSLLAGAAGIEDLEAIHLTADNVVIDDAIIVDAMIDNVSASKLTAGTIYTSLIRIQTAEEDDSLYIDNSLIQMSEDDLVRFQAGKDATGEYGLYIWNADGKIMFDATGATTDGIGEEVIVNTHVANDANIAAHKLDISGIASGLNDSGNLVISAEQVTIGGGTLEYLLGTIEEEIYELQGVSTNGLLRITPYYALGASDTEPPVDDDEVVPALTDVALTDYSYTDVYENDGIWTIDNPGQRYGQYLWVRYYCEYNDGHVEWSTPVLLTDGYLRSLTSTMMTQLEVVEGEISAKVWLTDIEENITTTVDELWADIDVQLGAISLEVGDLAYSVGLSITDLEDRISNMDGVSDFKTYFCVWNSAEVSPPDASEIVPALTDVALTDYSFTDIYESEDFWTEEPLQPGYGQYLWVCFWIEYQDGHTEWEGPYCLTDDYLRQQWADIIVEIDSITLDVRNLINETDYLSEQWADITIELDSMSLNVGSIQNDLDSLSEQWAGVNIELNQVSMEVGSIQSDLENNYVTKGSLVLGINSETGHAELIGNADYIYLNGQLYAIDAYIEGDIVATSLYATNSYLEGIIESYSGHIGGWEIGDSAIYNQKKSIDDSVDSGIYIGLDGISLGGRYINEPYQIDIPLLNMTPDGKLYAYYAYIGTELYMYSVGDKDWKLILSISSDPEEGNGATLHINNIESSSDLEITSEGSRGVVSYSEINRIYGGTESRDSFITSTTTRTGMSISFGIGSGGYNRGVWDPHGDRWVIYADSSNTIHIGKDTLSYSGTTYGYRIGDLVWLRFYGVTGSTMLSALNGIGLKPAQTVSFPMVYLNNGNVYLGYLYYNGSWYQRVAPNYAGSGNDGDNYSGTYYGTICYVTSS